MVLVGIQALFILVHPRVVVVENTLVAIARQIQPAKGRSKGSRPTYGSCYGIGMKFHLSRQRHIALINVLVERLENFLDDLDNNTRERSKECKHITNVSDCLQSFL